MNEGLRAALAACPIVAILRGVRPDEVEAVGAALIAAGVGIVEVPLNSPEPFDSIRRLVARFGDRALIGAGTVLRTEDVATLSAIGARLVVMPHGDARIVAAAKEAGMAVVPGVATPSEAFAALAAGADALKLFPAEALPPKVVRAWRGVMPREALLIAVGGVTAASMGDYARAGANGFGVGSALFAPGRAASETAAAARDLVASARNAGL